MSMNPYLAQMYNTHGVADAAAEEQAKLASIDLFAKVAAAEGIDLNALDPQVREALYADFISKLAQEDGEEEEGEEKKAPPVPPKKEEDKEEKSEEEEKDAAARAEYAVQAEWQQKLAEADTLGRVMAHAFNQESNEIKQAAAQEQEAQEQETDKEAAGMTNRSMVGRAAKTLGRLSGVSDVAAGVKGGVRGLMHGTGTGAKGGGLGLGTAAKNVAKGAGKMALIGYGAKKLTEKARGEKKDEGKKEESKESSAFEELSAERGIKIAEAAGWDVKEAAERVSAVYTLGIGDLQSSEKVASVQSGYDDAVSVRGLEYLEAAGYPVNWEEVFGG